MEINAGGGFVAGLIVAMAIVTQYMAHGLRWTEDRILVGYRTGIAAGLLLAVVSGLISLIRGEPFLTHAHVAVPLPVIGEIHLGTALMFDLGVLLTVSAATLLALVRFAQIETRAPEGD